MVWFVCDDCGDTIKKPKLVNHFHSCRAGRLTCLDCSRSFDRQGAQGHVSCVTEHEKYALGATKPGGYAASGFKDSTTAAAGSPSVAPAQPVGLHFLSTRPPWRCSVCNVNCTSQDTLAGHASGVKHMRRAKAATAAAAGPPADAVVTAAAATAAAAAAPSAVGEQPVASALEPAGSAPAAPQEQEVARLAAADVDAVAPGSTVAVLSQPDKGSRKALKRLLKDLKQPDSSRLDLLTAAVGKKLKKSGKVGSAALQKLARKNLQIEEELSEEVLVALKNQLVAAGVCCDDGGKLRRLE